MAKVLVADDHPLFREAIRNIVAQVYATLGLELTLLEASEFDQVLDIVENEDDLDVVLLDLFMPGSSGLANLGRLRECAPATPVIVVSALAEPRAVRQAMACGIAGYIPKTTAKDVMAIALQVVLAGGTYFPPEAIERDPSRANPRMHRDGSSASRETERLTERQLAVLSLLAKGRSNKQIARDLAISEGTVKVHVTAILAKLKVSSRAEAIANFRQAPLEVGALR